LLSILKLLIILSAFVTNTGNANDDLEWANNLSDSAQDMVWQDLLKKFNEQEQLEGAVNTTTHSTSKLYVFVSSSMPIPLLKSYASDALKYDATLVFKGLPEGSFKELAELIVQLKDDEHHDSEDNIANATIDDESFTRFDVSSVPTIILTSEPSYHPNQTPYIKFDKIAGNVGIRHALEQFKDSGDLQEKATKRLERIND